MGYVRLVSLASHHSPSSFWWRLRERLGQRGRAPVAAPEGVERDGARVRGDRRRGVRDRGCERGQRGRAPVAAPGGGGR